MVIIPFTFYAFQDLIERIKKEVTEHDKLQHLFHGKEGSSYASEYERVSRLEEQTTAILDAYDYARTRQEEDQEELSRARTKREEESRKRQERRYKQREKEGNPMKKGVRGRRVKKEEDS